MRPGHLNDIAFYFFFLKSWLKTFMWHCGSPWLLDVMFKLGIIKILLYCGLIETFSTFQDGTIFKC